MPMFPLGILKQQISAGSFTGTIVQTLASVTQAITATFTPAAGTYSGSISQTFAAISQTLTDVLLSDATGDTFTCSITPPTAVSPTGQTFSC